MIVPMGKKVKGTKAADKAGKEKAAMENFSGLLKSGLFCLRGFQPTERFRQERMEYMDSRNRGRIRAKFKAPPARYRQQALSAGETLL